MSANAFGVLKAVRDRLIADTGTGGLFDSAALVSLVNGIHVVLAPQASIGGAGAIVPYIYLVPVANAEEPLFTTATYAVQHQFQVSIFTPVSGGLQAGDTIAERVRVRLNRWQPTITGWAPSPIMREDGQGPFEDEGNYHHVEQYSLYMAKA